MAWTFGGKVEKCDHREYGYAEIEVIKAAGKESLSNKLFEGLENDFQVSRVTRFLVTRH